MIYKEYKDVFNPYNSKRPSISAKALSRIITPLEKNNVNICLYATNVPKPRDINNLIHKGLNIYKITFK
jgi:hypothetical protein